MKKTKEFDKGLLIICATVVIIIGSLIFILPQKDFSESENRYLSKMPKFSINSLLNGDYTKGISSFYTDQFPLRKIATSAYAISERAMGKNIIGGVIQSSDKLISIPKKEIINTKIPITAICVQSKYSLFKSNSKEILHYYNTDHHRTTYGAYLIYLEVCQKLKIKPYPESYFTKIKVCEDFYGTDFFKSRLPKFMSIPDSIELWRYENDENITFTVHGKNESISSFYDFSKLKTSDKYSVFLGGNYAHSSIFSSTEKPTLLLFKDSFANAVIPFLSLHFNIDIVDPRYATKAQIYEFYNNTSYDYRLFIGCLESFG